MKIRPSSSFVCCEFKVARLMKHSFFCSMSAVSGDSSTVSSSYPLSVQSLLCTLLRGFCAVVASIGREHDKFWVTSSLKSQSRQPSRTYITKVVLVRLSCEILL